MSQSATPAKQNDRTTCVETFEKEKFCGFPHRHSDTTGKPETRDKTRGCRKTSISYETSDNFHSWQHDKSTKIRTFRARLPSIFTLCSFKIDVFLRVSLEPEKLQPQNRCFVPSFRQFSPHRTKCHACHGICTLSPLDAALPMRLHATRHV